jgi:hypothetical protein
MDTIILGGGRGAGGGANFCQFGDQNKFKCVLYDGFCEEKKNERLQILKKFLFLKLPYLDNKFQ